MAWPCAIGRHTQPARSPTLEELPEQLLIGTGAHGQLHPDPATLDGLRARGIKVEALPTAAAAVRDGELELARTTAALHLTC